MFQRLVCFVFDAAKQDGSKTKLEKAKITLNDCLACSGCITSAESVLIAQQSHDEFYKILNENNRFIQVISHYYT